MNRHGTKALAYLATTLLGCAIPRIDPMLTDLRPFPRSVAFRCVPKDYEKLTYSGTDGWRGFQHLRQTTRPDVVTVHWIECANGISPLLECPAGRPAVVSGMNLPFGLTPKPEWDTIIQNDNGTLLIPESFITGARYDQQPLILLLSCT